MSEDYPEPDFDDYKPVSKDDKIIDELTKEDLERIAAVPVFSFAYGQVKKLLLENLRGFLGIQRIEIVVNRLDRNFRYTRRILKRLSLAQDSLRGSVDKLRGSVDNLRILVIISLFLGFFNSAGVVLLLCRLPS